MSMVGIPGDSRRLPRALKIGMGLLALVLGLALYSAATIGSGPPAMGVADQLAPPSATHPFGADAYGRDELQMAASAATVALAVPFASVLIGMAFGVPLGMIAALSRSWVDEILMRTADVIFAFPALLLALLLAAALGPGGAGAIAAIGIFNIPVFARVARAAARREAGRDYVLAARLMGRGPWSIARRDILPNIADGLLVQAAIQLSLALIADAGLAYIGLGVQPPIPSWGRMLADAQTLYTQAPWLVLVPGGAILITVFAFTLVADGLRDLLNPKRGSFIP